MNTSNKYIDFLDEWIRLYKSGMTAVEIAKKYNVHSSNVYYNLHKAGQEVRTKSEVRLGDKHPLWKGDNVGYKALHVWIKSRLPKASTCDACKKVKPYDLANKSQNYKRDVSDWEWLCRRCHMIKDGRLKKLNNKNYTLPV